MEPVEIDFIYGGNTGTEGKKIEQSMEDITAASKKAQADVTQAAKAQAAVIKQIESDISQLEKQLSQAAPGRAKQALQLDLSAAKRSLEEEKDALNQVNTSIDATAQKHVRLRTQVMEAKDELSKMEMAGKRGTAEYTAMAQKLGMLNDQMGDTTQQAKILADDEGMYKAVASGVAGIAGAMSAAVGVASLFGAEQEDLVKIQTRLQSVMAITIGIQQVAETLNKDSYFNMKLLTKAKGGWAAAQAFLNTQLGIGVGLSRALMISGIGLLIAGIGALIVLYQSWHDQQAEVTKAQKEFNNAVAESASKPITAIKELSAEWNALGDNLDAKKKFLVDNKNKFDELGWSVNGVTEAERILSDPQNLQTFIDAQIFKAKAIAATQLAAEKYKVALEKQLEWEKTAPKTQWKLFGLNLGTTDNSKYSKLNAERVIANEEGNNLTNIAADNTNQANRILGGLKIKAPSKTTGAGSTPHTTQAAKNEYDAKKALSDQLLDLQKKTAALEIDIQEDSLQKRLKQIDNERDQELAAIGEKQQDILAKYNESDAGKKKPAKDIKDIPGIDPVTLQAIEDEKTKITTAAATKQKQETEATAKEMADIARRYAGEEINIRYEYQQDIDRLTAAGNTEAANAAAAERDARISDVTAGLITESELYKVASDDKLQVSAETTAKLIENLRIWIDAEVKAGRLSADTAKKMLADLDNTGMQREKDKKSSNPFSTLIDGIKDYKKAKKDLAESKGLVSDEDYAKMESAAKKSLKSAAGAAAGALDATNQIIGTTVGALDSLGLLSEEQKKNAQDVMGMVGGAATIAKGIATGNPVDIITGSINLLASAFSLFDKKSKDIAKKQKQHKENIADLERAYNKLQRAVDNALGTDVYFAQRQEIENQKKQIKEYEGWIAQENRKKKKKRDQEAIKDAQDKIQELKNNMADEAKAITESLAQTDAKSLAGELADAMTTAFSSGEDAALAFGDVAEKVMQNAVKNALKLQFLEKPMQSAVDQLAQDMESGGTLTDAEQAAFRKKIEDAGKIYYNQLAQYSDLFTNNESGTSASGIKGDVANMTEETGSALAGQITAMRLNVVALLNNSKSSLDSVGKILATLENIKLNTDRLVRMDETLYYLKINGIKVQ